MNRLVATALAAACTLALAAAPAAQAADPGTDRGAPDPTLARWDGGFDVTGTFVRDDLDPQNEGVTFERTLSAVSSCAGEGACDTITVRRVLGDGSTQKYRMQQTRPGTYTGRASYEASWYCTRRSDGRRLYTWTGATKDTLVLTATGADSASTVTQFTGSLTISYTPYRIRRDVPASCRRYFADQGIEEGERPTVKASLRGVRQGG